MHWIETQLAALWVRFTRNTALTDEQLAFLRIAYACFAVWLVPTDFRWLSETPSAFFSPPTFNPAGLLDRFPSRAVLTLLDVANGVLLGLIALGVRAHLSLVLHCVLTMVGTSFAFSFGKVDHSIFYLLVPGFLALTPCAEHFALRPSRPPRIPCGELVVPTFALLYGFGLFTAGFKKALVWVDFDLGTSGFLSWFYTGYQTLERNHLLADWVPQVPVFFWEGADYSAVLFELSGVFFLWASARSWRLFIGVASVFHLLNALLLNIPFLIHVMVYLIFLCPVIFRAGFRGQTPLKVLQPVAVAGAALRLLALALGYDLGAFFHPRGPWTEQVTLWLAVAAWPLLILAALLGEVRLAKINHSNSS